MLNLLSKQAFMPARYVLVLHVDPVVCFKHMHDLVCFVLLLVCLFLIGFLDLFDSLPPVAWSLGSSRHLSLKLLEPITFFNMQSYLLTFRCSYASLDSKVKTNLCCFAAIFSIALFLCSLLFLLLKCRDFQEIPICSLQQVRICKLASVWNLVCTSHKNAPLDSH